MALPTVQNDETIKMYLDNKRELMQYQREYKYLIDRKLLNRKETVIQHSINSNLALLNREKDELKTQLYVTNGTTHVRTYNNHIDILTCHVACQDKLSNENEILKNRIHTMERQIKLVEKNIYNLNCKTIPDGQQIEHAKRAQKILDNLENQIEVSKLRESKYYSENYKMRGEIIDMLYHRDLFNKFWHSMIGHLNRDKKYLVDLIENAITVFDSAIDVYQKFNAVEKKQVREMEIRKQEMQSVLQKLTMNSNYHEFLLTKAKNRELADLEPREYKRRKLVRTEHNTKIQTYQNVLSRIISFSGAANIEQAINVFQQQESLYYSYFNYSNVLKYKVANLNTSLNSMYQTIGTMRADSKEATKVQDKLIDSLKKQLIVEERITEERLEVKTANERRLTELFLGFRQLFQLCRCDFGDMDHLLGNHKLVTLFNLKKFMKILEDRLNKMIALCYVIQREKTKPTQWVVKSIVRASENPTDLDNIVTVQQCPECAEGEDVNPYDTEFAQPLNAQQAKEILREKVPQPEIQYRLHSLSQCRLPRSRFLASKK